MRIDAMAGRRPGGHGLAVGTPWDDGPWNPWRALRDMPWVTLYLRPMPWGLRGATDGVSRIWLDEQMLQVERRCTLAHELIHLEWGHREAQTPAREAAVRREAARRLIPWPRLLHLAAAELPLDDLADELWVTPGVLRDRLAAGPPGGGAAPLAGGRGDRGRVETPMAAARPGLG